MIPLQYRSIDPGSSFDSDNTNKISRIVTNGLDSIVKHDHLLPTLTDFETVSITPGICVKDDVTIQLLNTNTLNINDRDGNNNHINIDGSIPNPLPGTAYIVLKYVYEKKKIANVADLKFFLNIDSFRINSDPYYYLFLGCVDYTYDTQTGNYSLSNLRYSDTRFEIFTSIDGGASFNEQYIPDYINGGESWQTSTEYDVNGMYFTTVPGMKIYEYRMEANLNGKKQLYCVVDDFTNNQLTIIHNLGLFPLVQVIDRSTGQLINNCVTHSENMNSFAITLDPVTNVYVIYM